MMRSSNAFITFCLFFEVVMVIGLPPGFVDEGVSNMNGPNKAVFAPNPRKNGKPMMIVVAKDGAFIALEDPDNSNEKTSMGDMNFKLCTNGPRGVYSIAPHPDFVNNRYLYVWYTNIAVNCPTDPILGPVNRLSRFTIHQDTLQLLFNTEEVLLETPPSPILLHDGGGMFIGHDNLIYLAIGDGGALPYAQDTRNLFGKLVRLTLNGGVPRENPFTKFSGSKGVNCRNNKGRPPPNAASDAFCEEMYAIGLRNPFRLGVDPNTNRKIRFAFGDVGNALWEEISYGGTDYIGTNYGFAKYEGICAINSNSDCPERHPAGYTEPFYWWQHFETGGAVTGVVFVPNNIGWPEKYDQLFVDYIQGKIFNLVADTGVGCRSCIPPRPNFRNETFHRYSRVVDVIFGPYDDTQALYYVSRGGGDNIRRIRFVGGTNRPPTAVITVPKNKYQPNETVRFRSNRSSDPEGSPLRYQWNFGNGRRSTTPNPDISYTNKGTFTVELTVTNKFGMTSKDSETIVVGTPPTVNFESPIAGQQFSVGDVIRLRGRARDSTGALIPPNQMFWEVRLRHAAHFHPHMPQRYGNDFDLFPAPPPEDFMAATNSFLQVFLTAVDSFNVSHTLRRDLQPRKVLLDIDTIPSGLIVEISDFNVQTPATITAWQNQNLKISTFDQGSSNFVSWNIGGARTRFYVVPEKGKRRPSIVARFR